MAIALRNIRDQSMRVDPLETLEKIPLYATIIMKHLPQKNQVHDYDWLIYGLPKRGFFLILEETFRFQGLFGRLNMGFDSRMVFRWKEY